MNVRPLIFLRGEIGEFFRKWGATDSNLAPGFRRVRSGGAALEQPELLVNDVRALFRDARAR